MAKTLEYYLALPYTVELRQSKPESWFVRVKELPGCVSQGANAEKAHRMIREAMRGWLAASLEDGDPIPEPRPDEEYSGQFRMRVPRSLHRDLVVTAEAEGVSLNQYINVALSRAVGEWRPATGKAVRARPSRAAQATPRLVLGEEREQYE